MRLFPVIRKVVTTIVSGGGGTNARAEAKPALAVSQRTSGTPAVPSLAAGVSVAPTPATLLVTPKPALAVSSSATGEAKPAVAPALNVASRLDSRGSTVALPAVNLTQVTFDLTHNKGGVTATTTGTWTTATNAQGDKNATLATAAGEVTAQTKTLRLDYTDLANKGSMTLTAVRLIFYTRLTGVLVGTSVTFAYSLDNGTNWTDLQAFTANYDDLAAGRSFTLSPLPSLAQVQGIQARVTAVFPAAGATVALDIDAIHLEVVATETWAI